MRKEFTPENITVLGKDDVFVFGSNLAGHHAGGAARVALERFGAVMGRGEGLQGQSYAIPTMQGGVETIKPYVDRFIAFAKKNHNKTFYVTRIGCGIAGFTDEQIAPLFEEVVDEYNVRLPKSFVEVIYGNRAKLIKDVLTPWPVKNYGVYELLVDLTLANDDLLKQYGDKSVERRIKLLKSNVADITRRGYLRDFPDRDLAHFLEDNMAAIISRSNEKKVLAEIGKCLGIYHNDPTTASMGRYFTSQCYKLAYLIFRMVEFPKDTPRADSDYASFFYMFFGTITGRWSCGDNSYMYEDMGKCLDFFCDELRYHEDEITENGDFSREKFLNFVSRPYIWSYCSENDGHALHEIQLIQGPFYHTIYEKEYKKVENFLIPVNNFSSPVIDLSKGRLSFPTFMTKELFIKSMLAKSDDETVR